MDKDLLVTGPEFALWTEGRVTVTVVKVWRSRGKIQPKGNRGRSPLYRLGDLMDVERETRQTVKQRGGRKRTIKSQASAA